MKKYLFISLFFPLFTLLAVNNCQAAYEFGKPFVDDFKCASCKQGTTDYKDCECTLDDMMLIAIKATQFVLGISGALALLMFILGGAAFLVSGLNSKWREWGKSAIKNAVIGLVIIFTSWMIVNFVASGLGAKINSGLNISADGQ